MSIRGDRGLNDFGLFAGILFIVFGLILSIVAPLIGPNVFIGFRIGYTYADKRVWNKVNIIVGLLMMLVGFFFLLSSYFFELTTETYTVLIVSGSAIIFVFGYWYARELAEKYLSFEPIEGEIIGPLKPFQLMALEKLIFICSYAVYNVFLLLIYLSGSPVPLNFSFSGEPSNFVSAKEVAFIFGVLGVIWFIIGLIFIVLGLKKPIILHAGLLSKRWGRDIVFKIVIYSVMIQFITMDIVLLSLYIYQETGQLLLSNVYFLFSIVIFSYFPLIYAVYRRVKIGKLIKMSKENSVDR